MKLQRSNYGSQIVNNRPFLPLLSAAVNAWYVHCRVVLDLGIEAFNPSWDSNDNILMSSSRVAVHS